MKHQKTILFVGAIVILVFGVVLGFNWFGAADLLPNQTPSSELRYPTIKTGKECLHDDGIWYQDVCWKAFEDSGIAEGEVDEVVNREQELIKRTYLEINNKQQELKTFFAIEEDRQLLFVYKDEAGRLNTLGIQMEQKKDLGNGKFRGEAYLFDGDAVEGSLSDEPKADGEVEIDIRNLEILDILVRGKLLDTSDGKELLVEAVANEALLGAGTSVLEIKGDTAYLNGGLGTKTYLQIKDLVTNHPRVKTIVFGQIPGSVNDAVNMHTGRLIREAGLTTKVLRDSDIASGGVDLFTAGRKRIVEEGAKIGVHSWCCIDDLSADELPKKHPAHKYQLAYFTMTLGKELGPAFYFYTLEAAPFHGVHYMTDEEIKKWRIATDFIPLAGISPWVAHQRFLILRAGDFDITSIHLFQPLFYPHL